MTLPLVLLVCAIVMYLLVRSLAGHWRRSAGLEDGELIGADDAELGIATLRSDRLGLVGRPDQILRVGRFFIPVEQKPSARRLYPSHAMQVAAQCMLVEEAYGVRPPYGVVVLKGGISERVPFTPELERRVHETIQEMRWILKSEHRPGPRWVQSKCIPCGYRDVCWDQDRSN